MRITRCIALLMSISFFATHLPPLALAASPEADSEANYDRLDGHGASGKKVNVVEWEGNLEIHVYPAGSLKGLALKLDKRDQKKPVMVIGYRFSANKKDQLIRRAILGMELQEGFKAYRDPSADGYDKIVISNNELSSPLAAFKLDPPLTQLYPEGHPALTQNAANSGRDPAASRSSESQKRRNTIEPTEEERESGTIHPFFMSGGGGRMGR